MNGWWDEKIGYGLVDAYASMVKDCTTQCPAVMSLCPAVMSLCPAVMSRLSAVLSLCPAVMSRLSAYWSPVQTFFNSFAKVGCNQMLHMAHKAEDCRRPPRNEGVSGNDMPHKA